MENLTILAAGLRKGEEDARRDIYLRRVLALSTIFSLAGTALAQFQLLDLAQDITSFDAVATTVVRNLLFPVCQLLEATQPVITFTAADIAWPFDLLERVRQKLLRENLSAFPPSFLELLAGLDTLSHLLLASNPDCFGGPSASNFEGQQAGPVTTALVLATSSPLSLDPELDLDQDMDDAPMGIDDVPAAAAAADDMEMTPASLPPSPATAARGEDMAIDDDMAMDANQSGSDFDGPRLATPPPAPKTLAASAGPSWGGKLAVVSSQASPPPNAPASPSFAPVSPSFAPVSPSFAPVSPSFAPMMSPPPVAPVSPPPVAPMMSPFTPVRSPIRPPVSPISPLSLAPRDMDMDMSPPPPSFTAAAPPPQAPFPFTPSPFTNTAPAPPPIPSLPFALASSSQKPKESREATPPELPDYPDDSSPTSSPEPADRLDPERENFLGLLLVRAIELEDVAQAVLAGLEKETVPTEVQAKEIWNMVKKLKAAVKVGWGLKREEVGPFGETLSKINVGMKELLSKQSAASKLVKKMAADVAALATLLGFP